MSSQTIFVVDDDRDQRDSIRLLLETVGYRVVAFASAEDFSLLVDDEISGCLILDIRLPEQSGLELYQQLLRDGTKIPAIFITAHADVATAVDAMKSGAIEFLEKPFPSEKLLDLVARALELDRNWRMSDSRYQQIDEIVSKLSPTDLETLELILQGSTNKAMAAKLFISERAVELRRQRLMRRLNVRSLPELLEVTITHRVLNELRGVSDQWPYRLS